MNEVLGLNTHAWQTWLAYRKKIKKPLKEASFELAQKRLAGFGDAETQMEAVLTSIANGWTGCFPPKAKTPWQTKQEQAAIRAKESELRQIAELEIRAKVINCRGPREGESVSDYRFIVERAERNEAERKYREAHAMRAERFGRHA